MNERECYELFGPTHEGVWGVTCKICRHSACGSNDPKDVEHATDCPRGDGTEGPLNKGL